MWPGADEVRPALPVETPLTPADLQWWWDVGLDGIVGAVLTGVIAGLALWVTIRHEREQAKVASAAQRREVAETNLRRAMSDVRAKGFQAVLTVPAPGSSLVERLGWGTPLVEALAAAGSEATTLAPELDTDLQTLAGVVNEAVSGVYNPHLALVVAGHVIKRAQQYLIAPGTYASSSRISEEDLAGEARADALTATPAAPDDPVTPPR